MRIAHKVRHVAHMFKYVGRIHHLKGANLGRFTAEVDLAKAEVRKERFTPGREIVDDCFGMVDGQYFRRRPLPSKAKSEDTNTASHFEQGGYVTRNESLGENKGVDYRPRWMKRSRQKSSERQQRHFHFDF